jgi:hypothetical protein
LVVSVWVPGWIPENAVERSRATRTQILEDAIVAPDRRVVRFQD